MLILGEDRTLSLYSTSGQKVSSLTFPEEVCRARDLSVCRVRSGTGSEGQFFFPVSVITSSGMLFVFSLEAMFESTATFERCFFSSYSIKVEPRLTCTVAWALSSTRTSPSVSITEDAALQEVSSAVVGNKRSISDSTTKADTQKEIDRINSARPAKKVRFNKKDKAEGKANVGSTDKGSKGKDGLYKGKKGASKSAVGDRKSKK